MNDLATKLRLGIQQSHNTAEHSGFMTKVLQGKAEKTLFTNLLSNLYFVYNQLETEINLHEDHPLLSRFNFKELKRTANLAEDLTFYYGSNWPEKLNPNQAAKSYISRIKEVSENEPILLIGHSYTRYMGDLSGGQGIRKIARATFNLPEHEGTRFYEFDQIGDIPSFKEQYRQALNNLPLEEDIEDLIVKEANMSFNFNLSIMQEIEQSLAVAA